MSTTSNNALPTAEDLGIKVITPGISGYTSASKIISEIFESLHPVRSAMLSANGSSETVAISYHNVYSKFNTIIIKASSYASGVVEFWESDSDRFHYDVNMSECDLALKYSHFGNNICLNAPDKLPLVFGTGVNQWAIVDTEFIYNHKVTNGSGDVLSNLYKVTKGTFAIYAEPLTQAKLIIRNFSWVEESINQS